MKRKMKVIARHKWLDDCTITESYDVNDDTDNSYRRFTATILGWRNFKIFEGYYTNDMIAAKVLGQVVKIKERIEMGDEIIFQEDVTLKEA